MEYRKLSAQEISTLTSRGCRSLSWEKIMVKDPFSTERIWNCEFSGQIRLGSFTADKDEDPDSPSTGIYSSRIISSDIGDNCLVRNLTELRNYRLQAGAQIENSGTVSSDGNSLFGNGLLLTVLNEGGGRECMIYDGLSAQTAYLQVHYRHAPEALESLRELILNAAKEKGKGRGSISGSTIIRNTGICSNIRTEGPVEIDGAARLTNGSIIAAEGAPSRIGAAVIADGFIVQSGSSIDSGALLDHCFIGQSVRIGKQFSAENSLVFANSELFHGEACSVFAGPYTVSHHKSSLLIAAFYSFFNAGSGTNQSNHLYKLGPLHQGVLERGAKTGSFSYMLCPSRVAAFSAVIGKHYSHFDASDFPFSYISEEEGKSVLTPAMNLLTVGTRRDSDKWPKRDRRAETGKIDSIHFDLFSPWLIQKLRKATALLRRLYDETDRSRESVLYKGLVIRRLMLKSAAKYYDLALSIAAGQAVSELLNTYPPAELLSRIDSAVPACAEKQWIDMAGLFMHKDRVDSLLKDLSKHQLKDIRQLQDVFHRIHDLYPSEFESYRLAFLAAVMESPRSSDQLASILEKYAASAAKLNNMILADADKEFSPSMRYSYGIDGDEAETEADFSAVRGKKEENAFIRSLLTENEEIGLHCSQLIERCRQKSTE